MITLDDVKQRFVGKEITSIEVVDSSFLVKVGDDVIKFSAAPCGTENSFVYATVFVGKWLNGEVS